MNTTGKCVRQLTTNIIFFQKNYLTNLSRGMNMKTQIQVAFLAFYVNVKTYPLTKPIMKYFVKKLKKSLFVYIVIGTNHRIKANVRFLRNLLQYRYKRDFLRWINPNWLRNWHDQTSQAYCYQYDHRAWLGKNHPRLL